MMEMFIVSFLIMVLVVVAMAIGVIFGRPSIKGSCGGLNNGEKSACLCSARQQARCEKRHQAEAMSSHS